MVRGMPEPGSVGGPSERLLELRGVSKSYGPLRALADVSFHVDAGEIVGLLGDNGAGKSTVVKTISGLVRPDAGALVWRGQPVFLTSRAESASLGIEVIYQDSGLVDGMSVARNIFMGREPRGRLGLLRYRHMRSVAAEVLREVVTIGGIESPDKPVGALSGGQKQAVAIARAVHFNRALLVLDEPTSALAARATQALIEYLRSLREVGLSSLLITHDLYDAYRLCDRFVVMSRGEVVLRATREETSVEALVEAVSRA